MWGNWWNAGKRRKLEREMDLMDRAEEERRKKVSLLLSKLCSTCRRKVRDLF